MLHVFLLTKATDDCIFNGADFTNAMLDQVERLIEAQRAVSDQTAHEIRTPLMHLDTRILKAMQGTQDEELLRTLDQSRGEIRNVVRLLDSLLDIAGTQAILQGLRASMASKEAQRDTLEEQLRGLRDLARDGYIARNRLLENERLNLREFKKPEAQMARYVARRDILELLEDRFPFLQVQRSNIIRA